MSVEDLVNNYSSIKKKMMDELQEALKGEFKAFFDANPKIKFLTWYQFTDYFNDGDTCTFHVHDVAAGLEEDDQDDSPYELHEKYHYWPSSEPDPLESDVREAYDTFTRKLATIPDEIFEAMFGDRLYSRRVL